VIAAVLAICLQATPAQCAAQNIRIEPDACHLRPYRAEVPAGSEWRAVTVRLTCQAAAQHRHS
jgi:hypothetical protein